jgi:hypothetical protein
MYLFKKGQWLNWSVEIYSMNYILFNFDSIANFTTDNILQALRNKLSVRKY